jgi:PAS domain S-box-containing protein
VLVLGLVGLARKLRVAAGRRARAKAEPDRFFGVSPDLMWVAGPDGFFTRVNPAFGTRLGYTEDEALARPYPEFVHPDDRGQTEAAVRRVWEGKPLLGFENRLVCKDGSYRWFEWTLAPFLDEGLIYGIGRDVTERRQAESVLSRFFRLSPDLMVVVGFDGLWNRVNPAYETRLGYTEAEVVGRPFLEFAHPDDREQVMAVNVRLREGEPLRAFEARGVCKDGSYRWIEWTAASVIEEGMIYAVGRDVTERHQGESELAASRRRIVAAADEVRRRIERDLHDGTQQRLVSLGLAVRAMEADVPVDRGDLRAELSRISAGLMDAVGELQELSRGIHPAILSQGGLGPALQTLARRSPIPVTLDVEADTQLPEPVEVGAYFVASEALANAVKHAQASRIEVSLAQRHSSLVLSIRDDGVGGAGPGQGSGLIGLQDRVEALGGTIRIDSPPGAGTSLVATLPLNPEPTG